MSIEPIKLNYHPMSGKAALELSRLLVCAPSCMHTLPHRTHTRVRADLSSHTYKHCCRRIRDRSKLVETYDCHLGDYLNTNSHTHRNRHRCAILAYFSEIGVNTLFSTKLIISTKFGCFWIKE